MKATGKVDVEHQKKVKSAIGLFYSPVSSDLGLAQALVLTLSSS